MVLSFEPQTRTQPSPMATALGGQSGQQAQNPGTVGQPGAFTSPSFNDYSNLFNLGQVANLPFNVATDNRVASLYNQVGLTGGLADLQRQDVNRQAGFDRERLGMNRALLGDQQEDLGARRGDIEYWHKRQLQNFMGGQAARGATHTEGTTRGIGDFENERARLLRSLGMDEKQLGRTSRNLGIQEEELGSRVQSALDQIGLGQALKVEDIFTAIQDAEAGRFNPLQSLLGNIYQLSGIRPVVGQSYAQPAPDTAMAATKDPRVR